MFEALLGLALLLSIVAVHLRDLLHAVIVLAAADLVIAALFYLMAAPDIAITQATVVAGLTTLIFMLAIHKTRRTEE